MEQSSTPWRVFDAPAPSEDEPPQGSPGASPVDGSHVGATRLALGGLAAALAVGAVAVAVVVGSGGSGTVDGPGASTTPSGGSAAMDGHLVASGRIVIDVVGAVVSPGVYELPIGSRIGDAITAAGGFGPRVDADLVAKQLNLAAPLKDGDQVRVPARGDAASGGTSGGGANSGGGVSASGGSGGALVNLNSATAAELDALPGIGPVTAAKIIDARAKAPFTSVDDLRSRNLVSQKVFDQIRAQLTVG